MKSKFEPGDRVIALHADGSIFIADATIIEKRYVDKNQLVRDFKGHIWRIPEDCWSYRLSVLSSAHFFEPYLRLKPDDDEAFKRFIKKLSLDKPIDIRKLETV